MNEADLLLLPGPAPMTTPCLCCGCTGWLRTCSEDLCHPCSGGTHDLACTPGARERVEAARVRHLAGLEVARTMKVWCVEQRRSYDAPWTTIDVFANETRAREFARIYATTATATRFDVDVNVRAREVKP